ncbi:unnamed protein product [Brassica oleracea var. botrytis]|uniref:Uncharacterized protein n=1 Tax=Brassica oleracea var. oleracea TaxID=109376 RepID=A0A0D3BYZ3_BRAOL|nr:PREDICTED: mediator-associated protein 1-like [Brassica oleracea var. oleracea]
MTKKKPNPLEDPPKASSSDDNEVEALSGDDEEEQISNDSSSDDLMNPVAIPSAKNSKSEKLNAVTKPKGGSLAVKKRPIETTSVSAKRAKIAEEAKKPSSFQRLWSEEDEVSMLQGMIDFKADTGKSPYEDMDRFYEITSKSISFEASKIQFVDKIRSLKRKYMGKVKHGAESLTKNHDIDCLKLANYIWGSHGMALNSNVKKLGKEEEVVALESAAKSSGTPKKTKKKPVSVEANGDKVEEDREALVSGDNGGEDRQVLAGGEKVAQDGEVLAGGEKNKEVLINGGGASKSHGVRASDWFEDSFLVGSIAGLGVSERFVKEKWSMVTVETKKRMEEKWKLLQAKEMELVLHKTDFMREIGSVIAEAS